MTLFQFVVTCHKFRRKLWQQLATHYQAQDLENFRKTWKAIEAINSILEVLDQPVQLDSALEE